MAEAVPLGDFIASLPYMVGYELTDQHVAAVAVPKETGAGPVAAIHWDTSTSPDRDLAEDVAARLARVARQSGNTQFLLVGYGPSGPDRTNLLAEALLATADLPDPIQVHVADGTWRVRNPDTARWSPARPLPDVSAAAVLRGLPTPAASRDELAHRFDPLPAPLYGEVSAHDAQVFADSAPTFRADVALRILDQLATPGTDDPSRMATLAHLTATAEPPVRDAILAAAAGDPAKTDVLVRTYQTAPATQRPALATAAATAVYLHGGQSSVVEEILRHADRDGPNARLTALVDAASRRGLNPYEVRHSIAADTAAQLERADADWHRSRTTAVRDASFPTPPRTTEQTPRPSDHRPPPDSRAAGPDMGR